MSTLATALRKSVESAASAGALSPAESDHATLVIALSMAMTPVLFAGSERFLIPRLRTRREPVYDEIDAATPVIIDG